MYDMPHVIMMSQSTILLCFTVLLTIAIDSCLLFADRHVCMNVQLQGTKRTLLPHAMACNFIKMEFMSLVVSKTDHTNMLP